MNNDDIFKKTNNHPITPELEARVVAWVLGEASPFEATVLEQLCAESPELAAFKHRMEAVHGLVGEATKPVKEPLRLSPERRAKVLATMGVASTVEPAVVKAAGGRRKSHSWRSWALPLAACLTLILGLAAVMIPTVGKVQQTARKSAEFSARREVEHRVFFDAANRPQEEVVDADMARFTVGNGKDGVVRLREGAAATEAPQRASSTRGFSTNSEDRKEGADKGGYLGDVPLEGRLFKAQETAQVKNDMRFGLEVDAPASPPVAVSAPQSSLQLVGTGTYTGSTSLSAGQLAVDSASSGERAKSKAMVQWNQAAQNPPAPAAAPVSGISGALQGDLDKDAEPMVVEGKSNRLVSTARYAGGSAGNKRRDVAGDELGRSVSLNQVDELRFAQKGKALSSESEKLLSDDERTALKPAKQVIAFDESLRAEIVAVTEAVSTFSLHVSDASFRLAKAALARGEAPDPTTIRPEEFYNAFDYGDPSPVAGEPVSCRIEQAAHPFLQQRNLVRIALKVPAAGRGAGTPLRLTVLLDTSGSMEREDRAATVRAAFTALASLLGPNDRVTLVGFARTPRLLAESVAGDQAAKLIELAVHTPAEGGTNMEEALALAGNLAMRQRLAGAQNRIVLLTDGAANLGDADPQQLARRVEAFRQNGIAFDACGVVADGLDDSVLEALTRKGDGRYTILNSPEEADAVFARQLAGAFRPAAKDVKVQVRFNPARVARYRLIGFEQHRLKTEDFRNDAIDAAELAAEEAAVAVYQVEVRPGGEGELGEVSVRFLDTRTNERVERMWTLAYAAQPAAFVRATPSLQLAGSAAFLAEKLRGGALAGQIRLEEFAPVVEGLGAAYPQAARVRDFVEMFRQTRRLTGE